MTSQQRTTTDRVSDGEGWEIEAGYSRAARRGPFITVSGTTASDEVARSHPGDCEAQTEDALIRAVVAIEQLGGTRDDIVRTRLMLTPEIDWQGAARAHERVMGDVAPANTTVRVAGLIGEQFVVEVEVDAFVIERPA